jgi:7-keto-8-aminopelargonate synthetase-like enzyme
MGWWNASRQGPPVLIGDGAADIMDRALAEVTAHYTAHFGRPPTQAELEALLRFCLETDHETD